MYPHSSNPMSMVQLINLSPSLSSSLCSPSWSAECHQRTRIWIPLTTDLLLPWALLGGAPPPLPPQTGAPAAGLVRMQARDYPHPERSRSLCTLILVWCLVLMPWLMVLPSVVSLVPVAFVLVVIYWMYFTKQFGCLGGRVGWLEFSFWVVVSCKGRINYYRRG